MVPGAGLEPARPQWPGDFKSPVSTNFTTRAEGGGAEAAKDTTRCVLSEHDATSSGAKIPTRQERFSLLSRQDAIQVNWG